MMFGFFWIPAIIFAVFVAPIWIILHYVTQWRTGKALTREDEDLLNELWQTTDRLEARLNTLERILDTESPDWKGSA
jgi:phage shock protein B